GAGDPGHPAADVRPAAVVERREAPRRLVDPGPSPALDPRPVAESVRYPSDANMRNPDRTVLSDHTPGAEFVEVLVADDSARHVADARQRLRSTDAKQNP